MSRLISRRAALRPLLNISTAMPVGDIPGWHQVVAEDFNDDVAIGGFVADNQGLLTSAGAQGYALYRNRITTYPDGWGDTFGTSTYYPSKTLSVSNSVIDIYHYTESISGTATALGGTVKPILPSGNYKQTYGRFQYRMRASATAPYYGCVALCIDSTNWPQNGEFDWPEGDISGSIAGFYHPANATPAQISVSGGSRLWSDWHIYTVEWSPGLVKWFVDGVVTLSTSDRVPTGPMAFLVQSGSTGTTPDLTTTGHVQIDWMCVYEYAP